MEAFESNALENASCKPLVWWRFIFINSTHGQDKLQEFIQTHKTGVLGVLKPAYRKTGTWDP